jgi:hypothetical protein
MRATRDLKRMIRMVLEDEGDMERASEWLEQIGEKDPARAIELFLEMASYSRGKLQ